jgi:hypothetical protein
MQKQNQLLVRRPAFALGDIAGDRNGGAPQLTRQTVELIFRKILGVAIDF